MSRRHHGRPHHPAHGGAEGGRRVTGVSPSPAGPTPDRGGHVNQASATGGSIDAERVDRVPTTAAPSNGGPIDQASNGTSTNGLPGNGVPGNGAPLNGVPLNGVPSDAAHAPAHPQAGHATGPGPGDPSANPDRNGQCTAPQLRRFIKSRPYVPMHELRRRFGIDGGDDDVTPVRLDPGWVYVGLPTREGSLLGDLLRNGEIGYELSLDPRTPIVIGVYPMRPIPRS
jgi:hypothetical protein